MTARLDYRAPAFLPGGHLQTLAGALRLGRHAGYTRERWRTDDQRDFIDVDWAGAEGKPLLVLFHGLEGHSRTPYARRLRAHVLGNGWRFAVPHFRGCSGEPNLQLRSYHAGASDEVDWILRRFRGVHGSPVYAAGVSLGANALLKWLGEQGDRAGEVVQRAATICPTLDLHATGAQLERGFSLLYAKYFLSVSLRARALEKLRRFPGVYDERRLRAARTLRDFDGVVTAPVNGFRDVNDYWTRSSSGQYLEGIRVPTLVLSARNDPFTPDHVLRDVETLRDRGKLPAAVTLDFQKEGGHVGFPGDGNWLARRVYSFLAAA